MLYKDLRVCRLDREQHLHTCGYWYTVTSGCLAHTAFATRAGLDRWLAERGLAIDGTLPDDQWGTCPIIGAYRSEAHLLDAERFADLRGLETRDMSNGDWVEAIITDDPDGIKTVHTLNPNIRERKVFDYRESCALMR